jgi:hypothetical protein
MTKEEFEALAKFDVTSEEYKKMDIPSCEG